MNWPEPSRVRGLSGWLIIATFELAAPAKERIRLEIEAHYADAVQCHLTNGSTETEAEAAALAELGDARVAAKRFRWRHLTEKDAIYVEKQLWFARNSFWVICVFIFAVVLWSFSKYRSSITAGFLGMVILQVASFLVAKRSDSATGLRLFVSLQALSPLILGCFFITIMGRLDTTFIAFVCFISWRPIWICFKLWKVKDAQQEMPPHDTAAA